MTTAKKIGIIGAGIGGLTAGSLLTKQGHKVTLFERESCVGGRALTFQGKHLIKSTYLNQLQRFNLHLPFADPDIDTIFAKHLLNGYSFDFGFHVIGGGVVSNLNHLFSLLEEPPMQMAETRLAYINEKGYRYPFLSTLDKIKMIPNILRLLLAGEKKMKELDAVPMSDTIHRYGKGKMKLTLELFSRVITTVNDLHSISTGEAFRAQKNLLSGSKPVGYPHTGLQSISNELVHYLTTHGATIHLNTPVTNVDIAQNKVVGLKTQESTFSFDAIISNVPVQQLFSLVDKQIFPKDYVNTLQRLEGTGSLCAYYALDTIPSDLLGKTFLFIERDVGLQGNDAVGMIDCMTAHPNSGMAPPEKYLIQAYIICSPSEAKDISLLMKLKTVLDANLEKIMPHYHDHLQWALYPAIWQLDGVAKTIDNDKPSIQTPVQGFYLVGDCVKAPGVGYNCAVNAGKLVSSLFS